MNRTLTNSSFLLAQGYFAKLFGFVHLQSSAARRVLCFARLWSFCWLTGGCEGDQSMKHNLRGALFDRSIYSQECASVTNLPATWWFFDRVLFPGGSARRGVVPVFVTLLNRPLPLLPFWEPNGKGKVCWMWTLSSSNIHNTSRFNLKHWKCVLSQIYEFNTLGDFSWLDHIVGLDSVLNRFSGWILCNR